MPVIRVDNQQSPIPRPLLVVTVRNKSRSKQRKNKPSHRKRRVIERRKIHAVKAITPDLLWRYVSPRIVDKDGILRGLKYVILWPNQWPNWLRRRVKNEDLAAKLIGVELEPAWTQSIAHQLMNMQKRAERRKRFEFERGRPPQKPVRNPVDDILQF